VIARYPSKLRQAPSAQTDTPSIPAVLYLIQVSDKSHTVLDNRNHLHVLAVDVHTLNAMCQDAFDATTTTPISRPAPNSKHLTTALNTLKARSR
jgi:hypothetical protein